MPIDVDIRGHEVLGPMFREERREGRQEGRQEGELTILRLQIEKRFGALPPWAAEKLASLPTCDLEELSVRLLDIATLEELLR